MAKVTTGKYLSKTSLAYFYQRIKEIFVVREDGKGLSSNDFTDAQKEKLEGIDPSTYLTGVTGHDKSINVFSGKEISVRISGADDNALHLKNDDGQEGLYVSSNPQIKLHKLTFGADQKYVYDGSADVNVPVYDGTVNNH